MKKHARTHPHLYIAEVVAMYVCSVSLSPADFMLVIYPEALRAYYTNY